VSLDDLIFFPDRFVPDPPPGVGECWFDAADGVRLHAWWAPAPAGGPVARHRYGLGMPAGKRYVVRAVAAFARETGR
jgi:hypothetical protein